MNNNSDDQNQPSASHTQDNSDPVNHDIDAQPEPAYVPQQPVAQSVPAKVDFVTEVAPEHPITNPGIIVLQWLTYAFWGWTILSLGYLVAIAASYALYEGLVAVPVEPVAYGIAAIFILLPISFVCDMFYSKREPEHKHGAASLVMIIHAVLFALLAIGALIVIAFSLVNLVLTTGSTTSIFVTVITAATLFVLYAKTLVRVVRPFIIVKYRHIYRIAMIVIAIGLALWGILGPIAQTVRTKDDRAVGTSINDINGLIGSYVQDNSKLPSSVDVIYDGASKYSYSSDGANTTRDLVDRGLITYRPNIKEPEPVSSSAIDLLYSEKSVGLVHFYELCAVYTYTPDKSSQYDYYSPPEDSGEYKTTINMRNDKVGKNCYKLKATSYTQAL